MDSTAYVVCFFEIVNGIPVFRRAGHFSAPAAQLTNVGREVKMDVIRATGRDYEEAVETVVEQCRLWPPYRWLVPFLTGPF